MKTRNSILTLSCIFLGLVCFSGCTPFEPSDWKVSVPGVGFSSSPITVDLTQDGTLDIVVGAGSAEFQSTPNGVLALEMG